MLYSNFNEDQEFFDSYLTQPIENSDYFNSVQYINKCGPGFSISDDLKEHYSNVDNISNDKNINGGLDNGSDDGSGGGSDYGSDYGSGGESDYGSGGGSDYGSGGGSDYGSGGGSDYGSNYGSGGGSDYGSNYRPNNESNNGSNHGSGGEPDNRSNYDPDTGSNNKLINKSNIKQIGNKIISNAKSFFNIEKIKLFIIYLLSGIIIILIIHLWYRMQIIINNNCIRSRK